MCAQYSLRPMRAAVLHLHFFCWNAIQRSHEIPLCRRTLLVSRRLCTVSICVKLMRSIASTQALSAPEWWQTLCEHMACRFATSRFPFGLDRGFFRARTCLSFYIISIQFNVYIVCRMPHSDECDTTITADIALNARRRHSICAMENWWSKEWMQPMVTVRPFGRKKNHRFDVKADVVSLVSYEDAHNFHFCD